MNPALIINTYLLFLSIFFYQAVKSHCDHWDFVFKSHKRFRLRGIGRSSLTRVDVECTDALVGRALEAVGGGPREPKFTGIQRGRGPRGRRETGSKGDAFLWEADISSAGGPRGAVGLAELSRLSQSLREIDMVHQNFNTVCKLKDSESSDSFD